MAKTTKKRSYSPKKSKTNKVKEPMIDGLELKELAEDSFSEEDLLQSKPQGQLKADPNSTNDFYLRSRFLSNSFVLFYSLNKHLGSSNLVILPSIYSALATASELKTLKGSLEE